MDHTSPERRKLDDQQELQDAASETVKYLKSLAHHRLSRWLPLNLYVLGPIIFFPIVQLTNAVKVPRVYHSR